MTTGRPQAHFERGAYSKLFLFAYIMTRQNMRVCMKNVACEQALYSGGQRELFSLRAPKARVSANEVKASEANPR